jgi:hypothetical protein
VGGGWVVGGWWVGGGWVVCKPILVFSLGFDQTEQFQISGHRKVHYICRTQVWLLSPYD